jgi:glycosyltransferase involved in cell wall biosynthesis
LLRSLGTLVLKYPKLNLIIVGSGPQRSELMALANNLKIGKNVTIAGNISHDELMGLYSDCSLFVLLSTYEAQSIPVMEAIIFGKPALLTNSSALSEYIHKGLAIGVPYPPKAEEVASKIEEILNNNPPPSDIGTRFPFLSWDEVTEKLTCLYLDLAHSNRH